MWIPLVVVFVSALQISITRASCPPGWFGDSCLYSRKCGTSCDQETGVCPGVCDPGWVKVENFVRKKISPTTNMLHQPQTAIILIGHQEMLLMETITSLESGTLVSMVIPDIPQTVDLGREYLLHNIRVYLRYGYTRKIVNSFIYGDNNPSSIRYTFPTDVYNITNPMDLVCSTTARYVTIKNPGTGDDSALNICEVEIYTCSNGTYGRNCTELCHCSGCNQWSGICSGDCRPGWKGERCDTECDSYHYGVNCSLKCSERNCLNSSTCFHETGSCDKGCKAGWQGQNCIQGNDQFNLKEMIGHHRHCVSMIGSSECYTGHYGLYCSGVCDSRQCSKPSNCSHSTGECISGCKERWTGTDCTGRYFPHNVILDGTDETAQVFVLQGSALAPPHVTASLVNALAVVNRDGMGLILQSQRSKRRPLQLYCGNHNNSRICHADCFDFLCRLVDETKNC